MFIFDLNEEYGNIRHREAEYITSLVRDLDSTARLEVRYIIHFDSPRVTSTIISELCESRHE